MEQLLEKEVINSIDHENCDIIVYNDDVNTFKNVIDAFVTVLKHSEQQAEQLAMIIHNKGKAQVKHGKFEELQPLAEGLIDYGLNATIE